MNIQLICEKCDKAFTIKDRHVIQRHINKKSKILCKSCKIKESKILKYGSLEKAKEIIQNNREKAMMSKYGVKNIFELKDYIKEKTKEIYGVSNVSQLQFVKDKKKSKNKDLIKQIIKNKVRYMNNDQYSLLKTNYDLYNKLRLKDKFYLDGYMFDSSWEVYYYIFLRDNQYHFAYHPNYFEYNGSDGKVHKYFPDFKVNNIFIEIKGNQFFDKDGNPYHKQYGSWKDKYDCMLKNNVKILKYDEIKVFKNFVEVKYGSDYISSLRIKNSSGYLPSNSIKIKCIETNEHFDCIKDAVRVYGRGVYRTLRDGTSTRGKHFSKI